MATRTVNTLAIDRQVEALFEKLCLHLSFNPDEADHYKALHKLLLGWIKANYSETSLKYRP